MVNFSVFSSFLLVLGLLSGASASTPNQHDRPNIVLIITDDQDNHMDAVGHMASLQKHVIEKGTSFVNHFCTVALCCPSRVNLLTGKAAHNTNVTDVKPPWGGFTKFVDQGYNDDYLPVWLQSAGYNTYYVGKLMNGQNLDNYNTPVAGGFNGSEFLLDPTTYDYYNASMSRNGALPVSYKGQYSTDVIAEKTLAFLDDAAKHDEPFFLGSAPIGPHGQVIPDPLDFAMPLYPPRHDHLFKDYKIPRTKNFNSEDASGVGWVAAMPLANETVIEYYDEFQRARLRSLQAVDEMVEAVVQKLEKKGILENTYVFFTTDNGYHIGQHRLPPGKSCGFDTDIRIPLAVRGPDVPKNELQDVVSSHTDLTPTILEIAGQKQHGHLNLDGRAIPLSHSRSDHQLGEQQRGEHVAVEFWGKGRVEGTYDFETVTPFKNFESGDYYNNTYKGIRVLGEGYNLYYSVWCSNEKEYYDLEIDPDQMNNLLANDRSLESSSFYRIHAQPLGQIVNRLDALMMVMKSCKGTECIEPWETLHPTHAGHGDDKVKSLLDALHTRFDEFYASQPRVSFQSCEGGYIPGVEGPQEVNIYGKDGHWSVWT